MQGKLFQRCTHFLYCSVLSLGGKVNTRHFQNYQLNAFILRADTRGTLMHLFLFTNSAQRELVSICTLYAEYTQPQSTFFALVPWRCVSISKLYAQYVREKIAYCENKKNG